MNINCKKSNYLFFFLAFIYCSANGQAPQKNDTAKFVTKSAGPQYQKSGFYQFLFGPNYRKEWTTPVYLPVMYLDTLRGGLISIEEGGSNQSKSLHLKTAGDKEYALRSVDKTLDKVIPKPFYGTFVADVVNDEISMSDPYGALGVPVMADAIGINHTNPQYFYLPAQPALDTLKKKYGNGVYLLEKRPQGDWSDADDMGNFSKIEDTDDIFPAIKKDHLHKVDQLAFARARLLDMIIGDFDRHADQWKWGVKKEGDQTIYIPIPTDRDQAFSTKSGLLLNLIVKMSGMKFIQKYDYEIQNVKALTTINRLIDRIMTNEMTKAQWTTIATDVQQRLTDDVIEKSVKGMPPEIFDIRGNEFIAKLKYRRDHIPEYAETYYGKLAEASEVIGTEESELFEINNGPDHTTEIKMYYLDADRRQASTPFYSRIFNQNETDEIRLYGLNGKDIYKINGPVNDEITLRIIGGFDRDSIIDATTGRENKRYHVYDDKDNYFAKSRNMRRHLSEDSTVHEYNYLDFTPDKKGLVPHFGYNDDDRFFVGLRYHFLNNRWRKKPFVYKQSLDADYSLSQLAFSVTYNGLFPRLFGEWDLITKAKYDEVRWINFHGLGNETPNITNDRDYYRMRTEEITANLGVGRLKDHHKFNISGFYQQLKIIKDTSRFIYKNLSNNDPTLLKPDRFVGIQAQYEFADVKDTVLPQKGVTFTLHAKHTQNLEEQNKSYQLFSGNLNFFIPLFPKFSLAIKTGAATIAGKPEFYQYPSLGEPWNLRGFRRERFSGKTTLYNNAEIRFIKPVRSYIFNGKAGLMAFVDNGRVWLPGESSGKIHTSYGGGILLAPFNLMSAAVTYAVSDEIKMLQLRVGVLF